MTFEEFFKKKKINLTLLNAAEPALFAEFEQHYTQMGEKSFDHTKKYWFNMLRRKYVLPPDPKVEKVIIENQLAEQTITEAILEEAQASAPKLGFMPKFKAATFAESTAPIPASAEAVEQPAPKLGFVPKFKAGVTKPSTAPETTPPVEENPEVPKAAVPKIGFTPKFKPGITKTIAPDNTLLTPANEEPLPVEKISETPAAEQTSPPKLGFKPKFRSAPAKPPGDTDEAKPE